MRGRAVAARRAHNPEVGGSIPPPAIKRFLISKYWGGGSMVRAPACHAGGCRFESGPPRFLL